MSMYLPNLEELSFRTVFAFPKAKILKYLSICKNKDIIVIDIICVDEIWLHDREIPSRIGFASRICCSIQECFPDIAAKYCRISLVDSVFPAPDSPLITTH